MLAQMELVLVEQEVVVVGDEEEEDEFAGGRKCKVPFGVTVHCPLCSRESKLQAGDWCWIPDDGSSTYCLKHIPVKPLVKEEAVPLEPRWMDYVIQKWD